MALASNVSAQTREAGARPDPSPASQSPQSSQSSQATADETFDLNIASRHIVEKNFTAATDVAAGGDEGSLRLRVGVAVQASEIDVLLRNVQGRVRFRASLAPVLRLFEGRGVPAAPAETPNRSP